MNKSTQRKALSGRDFNQLIFIACIYININTNETIQKASKFLNSFISNFALPGH